MSRIQPSHTARDSKVLPKSSPLSRALEYIMPKPNPVARAFGYTILQSANHPDAEVCILVPFVNPIKSAWFDPVAKRLEADVGGARFALTGLPSQVVALLSKRPEKVLLVLVDTLSRARFSVRASEILVSKT